MQWRIDLWDFAHPAYPIVMQLNLQPEYFFNRRIRYNCLMLLSVFQSYEVLFLSISLSRLSDANTWWMEGSFSFAHLYTIHIKVNDDFVPYLWCLLPDKHLNTYTRLFQLLKAEALQINCVLNPTTVHIDFEMAAIAEVGGEFSIKPYACVFHFNQSILRHMASNGLQTPYNNNNPPDVCSTAPRLMALPLVPSVKLDQAFQAIVVNAQPVPDTDYMIDYVRDIYTNQKRALFDTTIWNCIDTKDRKTSSCKAYHRVINDIFIIVIQIHFNFANSSKIKKWNSNDAMGSCKWVLWQRNDNPFTC